MSRAIQQISAAVLSLTALAWSLPANAQKATGVRVDVKGH
jgi:hypothetical protein